MIGEGDRVVVRVTGRGTHRGEFQGIAPTGRQVSATGVGIARIVDGRIAESWAAYDALGLLDQLRGGPSELVLAMVRDMDAGDLDALRARFAPGAEWVNPMVAASGPEEIVAGIAAYRAAFSDFRHNLTRVVEDGATVMLEGEWLGTHDGPLETPQGPLPPTGRKVRSPFAAVAQTRDGQVRSVRLYLDPLAFMAQLGLAGEPALS